MVCRKAVLLADNMAKSSGFQPNILTKAQVVRKNHADGYTKSPKSCHIDIQSSFLSKTEDIDILEQNIRELSPYLLKILLQDKTTGRFIRWACDEYIRYGEAYAADKEILPELITGANTRIIQPRTAKSKAEQQTRTRKAAEVFTPGWICNEMLNHCDEEWFGRPNVFNFAEGKSWRPVDGRILFADDGKRKKPAWQRYVDSRCLEITCGEAPFLVGRYDTTTGEFLPIKKRIGILDRKLRVVHENTDNETDWYKWAKRAFESTYGYEYQGDNLLLARENLLLTFIDNYQYKFRRFPTIAQLKQMANIIAWNVWQMDGLKECAPFVAAEASQLELFDDLPTLAFPIICRLKDWRNKRVLFFRDLKGDKKMKFDYVIGNPPYQVSDGGAQASAKPVYHLFMQAAKKICAKNVCLIMPARFFTGGKGLDDFRNEMINDKRFKVLYDYADSKQCFNNVDIKGGVCHFIWDIKYNGMCKINRFNDFGMSCSKRYLVEDGDDIFIRENILVSIKHKVQSLKEKTLDLIASPRKPYSLAGDAIKSREKYGLPPMSETPIAGGYKLLGLDSKLKRIYRYLPSDYPFTHNNGLNKFKIFISESYGCGEIGDIPATPVLATPVLATPGELCTETFIQIGPFDTELEMKNCFYYIKTKFFRALVGIRKQTQHATRSVYRYVPIQDFTQTWTDEKLYRKYGLNKEEIDFIESVIKPME